MDDRASLVKSHHCITNEDHRVLILYTGGTIGMQKTKEGYAPTRGYLSNLLQEMPEFKDSRMPQYDIIEYDPLLDSSSMDASNWRMIARDILKHYEQYCGFVILHGTDTMAYTASALSLMLKNLDKIVILTGSQIPISEIRNDGRSNIITSVFLCAQFHSIPEVCIYFKDKLLRGNRTSKVDIWSLNAFQSINFPPLADINVDVTVRSNLILHRPSGKGLKVIENFSDHVVCIRLVPNMSSELLHRLCEGSKVRGIILEAYGAGNFPDRSDLLEILAEQIKNNVVVVILSQVHKGLVNMDKYQAGSKLKSIGCCSGFDMTPECAVVKLQFLLGQNLPSEEVKKLMKTNLVGEVTEPTLSSRELSELKPEETWHTNTQANDTLPLSYMASLGYFRPSPHEDETNLNLEEEEEGY